MTLITLPKEWAADHHHFLHHHCNDTPYIQYHPGLWQQVAKVKNFRYCVLVACVLFHHHCNQYALSMSAAYNNI